MAINNDIMGIGISTYNDYISTDSLLTSIITKTNGIKDKDYTILVVDDGTQNINIISNLENVCKNHEVRLIKNDDNRGVSYTFNKIVQNLDLELITIFSNDITVIESNWLKAIQYFLTQNNKIGMVGFPLLQKDGNTEYITEPYNEITPKLVYIAGGAVFGIKKSVYNKVINPDNSIGFYEEYKSFFEDTHFCIRLIQLGYYNYMLNWPLMVHEVSMTFRKNPELLSRLEDSRHIFSKYWKIPYDDLFVEAKEFVLKVLDNSYFNNYNDKLNNKPIKCLDQNLTEKETNHVR